MGKMWCMHTCTIAGILRIIILPTRPSRCLCSQHSRCGCPSILIPAAVVALSFSFFHHRRLAAQLPAPSPLRCLAPLPPPSSPRQIARSSALRPPPRLPSIQPPRILSYCCALLASHLPHFQRLRLFCRPEDAARQKSEPPLPARPRLPGKKDYTFPNFFANFFANFFLQLPHFNFDVCFAE